MTKCGSYVFWPPKCGCGKSIDFSVLAGHMDLNISQVIESIWKYQEHGTMDDLRKARWYLSNEVERLELLQKDDNELESIFKISDED